jgi:hypothetical protein
VNELHWQSRRRRIRRRKCAAWAVPKSSRKMEVGFCNGPGFVKVVSPLASHPFRRGRACRDRRALVIAGNFIRGGLYAALC